jgi:hypothetical protein
MTEQVNNSQNKETVAWWRACFPTTKRANHSPHTGKNSNHSNSTTKIIDVDKVLDTRAGQRIRQIPGKQTNITIGRPTPSTNTPITRLNRPTSNYVRKSTNYTGGFREISREDIYPTRHTNDSYYDTYESSRCHDRDSPVRHHHHTTSYDNHHHHTSSNENYDGGSSSCDYGGSTD